jgi:putative transcriptional regulator
MSHVRSPHPLACLAPLACSAALVLVHAVGVPVAGPLVETGAAQAPGAPFGQRRPGLAKDLAPGKLLVAARNLPDPNFGESVVLLVDYSAQGAMGLIVNRQTRVLVSEVFEGLNAARAHSAPVYFGGPVGVPGALALLRSDVPLADARHVFADVYMVNTRQQLENEIARHTKPDRVRIYLGYAGWGAGQLPTEMARGSWHVFPGDADVVFDAEPDSVWPRQIGRTDQWMVLLGRTGAPRAGRHLPARPLRRSSSRSGRVAPWRARENPDQRPYTRDAVPPRMALRTSGGNRRT